MRLTLVSPDQEQPSSDPVGDAESLAAQKNRTWLVGLTSVAFILLQSACTLVMGLSGFRVAIGLGALAAASVGVHGPATGFHRDAIRIPMMIIAVIGSIINLHVIWRIRTLRTRPSSRWRQQPRTRRRVHGENVQIAFAVLTLILVVAEFLAHRHIFRLS